MNLTEWLLVILAAFTGMTTVIQCIEMWILVKNQKETNNILRNPGKIIANLYYELEDDEEFREMFWGLIQGLGLKAYEGVTAFGKQLPEAVKETAYKKLPKPLRTIMRVSDMLGIDLGSMAKDAMKTAADKTVDEAAKGWGN